MASRPKCDISGTTTCKSIIHRQIRELKSRWQMRWAALEETITSEYGMRNELQQILDHIVCRAKSSGKSRKTRGNDDPDWMENRISTKLIRSFLRTIWPDPGCVDELPCEALSLDSYYGPKLAYLSLVDDYDYLSTLPVNTLLSQAQPSFDSMEDGNDVMQETLDINNEATIPETGLTFYSNEEQGPTEVSLHVVQTEMIATETDRSQSPNTSTTIVQSTAGSADIKSPLAMTIELPSSWYGLAPHLRHSLEGQYPWSSDLDPNQSTRARSLKNLVDASDTQTPGDKLLRDCESALVTSPIGTVIASDYKIQLVVREQRNFVVYLAEALFFGHNVYRLTAIRNPEDCIVSTNEKQLGSLSVVKSAHKNEKISKDDVGTYQKKKAMAVSGTLRPAGNLNKAADSQRKYIIKLIKKRQASDTYLHTFLCDGLIWTVQQHVLDDTKDHSESHAAIRNDTQIPNAVDYLDDPMEKLLMERPFLHAETPKLMFEVYDEADKLHKNIQELRQKFRSSR